MIIEKASIISATSTSHVPLADASHDVTRSPGGYVYRVWAFDTDAREYLFDTGINNYEPVCIFPQPVSA